MRPHRPSLTPPAAATRARSAPGVPGFALCRPLHAPGGPPWRARDTVTGFDVVLRPLAPTAGGDDDMGSVPEHPHLLVPRVVTGADGTRYAAVRHLPNGGLDALLARRMMLSPGEASTVLVAVGRSLAALHAAGAAHGAVTASAVVLDSRVRPMLDGSRSLLATRTAPSDDVRALGLLALELVGGADELVGVDALRRCLLQATDADPARRPTAAELARLVMTAVPPEPLRLTSSTALARPARSAGRGALLLDRRVPRGLLVVLAGVGALALSVGLGATWARVSASGDAATPPAGPLDPLSEPTASSGGRVESTAASSGATTAADWTTVLADLDAARGAAFANADTVALTSADADASPAMAADRVVVQQLAARAWQARGYRVHVVAVRVARSTAEQAWLDVTDRRDPYWLVASDGSVVDRRPLRPDAQWLVHLVRSAAGWRVQDVRAEPLP